jgi:hypothetical protein
MTPWTRTGLKFVGIYVIFEIILILAASLLFSGPGEHSMGAYILIFLSLIPGWLVLQVLIPLMTDNPVGEDAIGILSFVLTGVLVFAVGYFIRGLSSREKTH